MDFNVLSHFACFQLTARSIGGGGGEERVTNDMNKRKVFDLALLSCTNPSVFRLFQPHLFCRFPVESVGVDTNGEQSFTDVFIAGNKVCVRPRWTSVPGEHFEHGYAMSG
jgi:hypothetical protein